MNRTRTRANDESVSRDAAEVGAPADGAGSPADDPHAAALRRLDWLAWLLDSSIPLPLTQFRIGLDGLLGFIPGIGDAVLGGIALYPLVEARRMRVATRHLLRMFLHVGVDTAIGSIPVIGDIFDLGYRANKRTVDIVREQLRQRAAADPR